MMVGTHDENLPAGRRGKDRIDVDHTMAVLVMDLIGSKRCVAEIEVCLQCPPNILRYNYNGGYSPSGDSIFKLDAAFLAPTPRSVKSRVCRFYMKKKAEADQKNNPGAYSPLYCSLELYSSNPERVRKALYANVKSATVTIIDLDSKGLGRMKKWERLGRDAVKCTLGAEEGIEMADKRVCADCLVAIYSVISATFPRLHGCGGPTSP